MSAGITDQAEALGFDVDRLGRVGRRVVQDIGAGQYDGASIVVARHGRVVLDLCEGFAERAAGKELSRDSVFHLMSLSKGNMGRWILL